MSISNKILFTVSGWECRAKEGFVKNFDYEKFSSVIVFSYKEYKNETEEHVNIISSYCKSNNIDCKIIELSYLDNISSWHTLVNFFNTFKLSDFSVSIDISTIPRDLLWLLMYFLNPVVKSFNYIYYKPTDYNHDWLSKDPNNPRLLLKHSGIARFNLKNALVLISGFDTDRIKNLIDHYEPAIVYLGIQKGNQFKNDIRNNIEIHLRDFKGYTNIIEFSLDSYTSDCGFSSINEVVQGLKDYNLIVSSLGPKLSALSLYKCYLADKSIALSYVPCIVYNPDYSKGIGQRIVGQFNFSS